MCVRRDKNLGEIEYTRVGGEGGLDRNSPSLLAPLRISVAFGGTDGIGISANRNGTNCKGRLRFKR